MFTTPAARSSVPIDKPHTEGNDSCRDGRDANGNECATALFRAHDRGKDSFLRKAVLVK